MVVQEGGTFMDGLGGDRDGGGFDFPIKLAVDLFDEARYGRFDDVVLGWCLRCWEDGS